MDKEDREKVIEVLDEKLMKDSSWAEEPIPYWEKEERGYWRNRDDDNFSVSYLGVLSGGDRLTAKREAGVRERIEDVENRWFIEDEDYNLHGERKGYDSEEEAVKALWKMILARKDTTAKEFLEKWFGFDI